MTIKTTGYYYEPNTDRRLIAHLMKYEDAALFEAAERMAALIDNEERAVLVPMPSHDGCATYTRKLALLIGSKTGHIVCDCLAGNERESLYQAKKEGRTLPPEDLALWLREGYGNMAEERDVWLIDNVIASGATYRAAAKLFKNGANLLAFAEDMQ